jgi:phosphoribosylaminoimidazole-succinocarboxamide synthase
MPIVSDFFTLDIKSVPLYHRGKVRDVYQIDANHLLLVATDRLSAFDVVLPTSIPGKGAILTEVSRFWFNYTEGLVANHLQGISLSLAHILSDSAEYSRVADRAMVVQKLTPLPIEAIVRGYLIGSAWKDYREQGAISGIALPVGLQLAAQLPEPLYTPSTKAPSGEHDQTIDFQQTVALLGQDLAEKIRQVSLRLYQKAASYALSRGIIIADTKFEFGLNEKGVVVLMDEVLTPDSSRFWPAKQYRVGHNPPSFDKQFVRDYLESLFWDKRPPGPALPADIIAKTQQKYREVCQRLCLPPSTARVDN